MSIIDFLCFAVCSQFIFIYHSLTNIHRRTSLTARPPPAQPTDWYHPINDRKYSDLLPNQIPLGESLLDCIERTRLVWDLKITEDLKTGNNVMVVAHASVLKGLVKVIDGKLVRLFRLFSVYHLCIE